jgi:carboxymethylenebutenolidase
VIEHNIDIATPDGAMNSFVVHPDEGGPRPVVLLLMDAPGKRQELHDMASRIATAGYYVILGNLYYRQASHYNVFETGDRGRMFELMNSLSNAMVVSDAGAMIAHAAQDSNADATRVGVVGYCMSGPFAISVAAGHPAVVKSAASMYGVRLAVDTPDSPHLGLGQIAGEIYVGAAETDEYAPPEMIAKFEVAAAAVPTKVRVEWYPGTHHGFGFPGRPQYHREAAERHWLRLHDMFARTLGR